MLQSQKNSQPGYLLGLQMKAKPLCRMTQKKTVMVSLHNSDAKIIGLSYLFWKFVVEPPRVIPDIENG